MPMSPFYTRFRDLAFREMRAITVRGLDGLEDGEYGFLEYYCDEADCDCRRVIVHVLRADTGRRVWASIGYGWEPLSFHVTWMHGDNEASRWMSGATLEPFNPQSEFSKPLLRLFQTMIDDDPAYVARLSRHYAMFKAAAAPGAGTGA